MTPEERKEYVKYRIELVEEMIKAIEDEMEKAL